MSKESATMNKENVEKEWTFDDLTINIAVYWGIDKVPLQGEFTSFDAAEAGFGAMRRFVEKNQVKQEVDDKF